MIFLFIKLVKVLNFVFDKLTVAKERVNFFVLTSVFLGEWVHWYAAQAHSRG
jgi:hypothetical protein